MRILVVRLGAMGDVIHSLPAVASLKHSLPQAHLSWLIESRWAPLLEGNPFLDEVIAIERRSFGGLRRAVRGLRGAGFDLAIDFQGLIKSALAASLARPERIHGFHPSQLRERLAGLFYSHLTSSRADHVVEQNLDLAAEAGATSRVITFPLPEGREEPGLPDGPFVLASPLAGWGGKQWPLAQFHALARLLGRDPGVDLVMAGPPGEHYRLGPDYYACTVAGLIHATRRASAVVGLDSGPLHLAAALGRPGVAIYGPTDPKRNGPYGDTFTVLRAPGAVTTYRRGMEPVESMRQVTPEQVHEALQARITRAIPARRSA